MPSAAYFGRFANVATHAVSSPFSSTVPSSSTVAFAAVAVALSYTPKVTFAPLGTPVVPSAFNHAFVAVISTVSLLLVKVA